MHTSGLRLVGGVLPRCAASIQLLRDRVKGEFASVLLDEHRFCLSVKYEEPAREQATKGYETTRKRSLAGPRLTFDDQPPSN